MECESMFFVKNLIPYLWDLSNSFSNSFIDFYSCEGQVMYQEEWTIKLRVENGCWHESLNLLHVSRREMLHFVTSYMNQNKSHKQTLESAQYGLEISFKQIRAYKLSTAFADVWAMIDVFGFCFPMWSWWNFKICVFASTGVTTCNSMAPSCTSIDNLKASVKGLYSVKLTRISKAGTYWDNTFQEIHDKLKKMKKLTHVPRFPTPTVKPKSYEDKAQMFLRSRSVRCLLSHVIVDAIADSISRILLVPNVVLNS